MIVQAPAKINLFLHITGRRPDGFHTLDSLFVFADAGDEIEVRESDRFSFSIDGPYAAAFPPGDMTEDAHSTNLAVRAARSLAAAVGRAPSLSIRLTKNLPLASGMGGGSADAAAVIRAILALWRMTAADIPGLDALLLSLGADVPACMKNVAARVGGIGETSVPVANIPPLPALLVNPGKPCPTAEVFRRFGNECGAPAPALPDSGLIGFLKKQRNDLTAAAIKITPEIETVLHVLAQEDGALLSRMSGSGATCFSLFADRESARKAAARIRDSRPAWWVRDCVLNPA